MRTFEKPALPNMNTYLVSAAPQNLLTARARLGECPVWDAVYGHLYWVDVYNYRVHQLDLATGADRYFDVGEVVSALVLVEDGQANRRLLIARRCSLAFLDVATGAVTPIHAVSFSDPDTRFNDGKCDAQGRLWIGSISQVAKRAELYRYDPDGAWQVMETGLTISNGLGWSPDGTTFYLTDSAIHTIYAYDFEATSGCISNRRVFVDLKDEAVEPDGLTLDQQGNVWSALWNGWGIVCFDPNGQELLRVKFPVQRPTSLTFGGPTLTDLFITSASVGLSQSEIQQGVEAGDVFCLPTQATGLPTQSFGNR